MKDNFRDLSRKSGLEIDVESDEQELIIKVELLLVGVADLTLTRQILDVRWRSLALAEQSQRLV